MAGSRLIVHESVHDALVAKLVERVDRIKLGDPTDPDTEMGPVANRPQYEKVLGYLRTAVDDDGATAACGGGPADDVGGPVRQTHRAHRRRPRRHVVREEIFGPVLSVYTFTDEDDAVRRPTTRRTGSPGRSGRRTCTARIGSPVGSAPARCGSTPSRAVAPERAVRRCSALGTRPGERATPSTSTSSQVDVGRTHGGTRTRSRSADRCPTSPLLTAVPSAGP